MLVYLLVGLGVGLGLGYLTRRYLARQYAESAEAKAERILEDAKIKQKDFLIQAKDKAIKIIDEAKKEENERRREINALQGRLEKRETLFDQKLLEADTPNKSAIKITAVKTDKAYKIKLPLGRYFGSVNARRIQAAKIISTTILK